MNNQTSKEYQRLRKAGFKPMQALSAARTLETWKGLEYENQVRLEIVPDEDADWDNLCGDTFNPDVNTDIPAERLKREEKEFEEKVNREGVWGVVGKYWNGHEWVHGDSCWGFVGDDWKDSGYDTDIMAGTITEYQKVKFCIHCHSAA